MGQVQLHKENNRKSHRFEVAFSKSQCKRVEVEEESGEFRGSKEV